MLVKLCYNCIPLEWCPNMEDYGLAIFTCCLCCAYSSDINCSNFTLMIPALGLHHIVYTFGNKKCATFATLLLYLVDTTVCPHSATSCLTIANQKCTTCVALCLHLFTTPFVCTLLTQLFVYMLLHCVYTYLLYFPALWVIKNAPQLLHFVNTTVCLHLPTLYLHNSVSTLFPHFIYTIANKNMLLLLHFIYTFLLHSLSTLCYTLFTQPFFHTLSTQLFVHTFLLFE